MNDGSIHITVWTDDPADKRQPRARVAPPRGYSNATCSECGSTKLQGALITDTADALDPNLICAACGHWRD